MVCARAMKQTRLAPISAAALAVIAAAGCAQGSHDRVGGTVRHPPTILTLAVSAGAGQTREWVDAVQRLSHGSLRIELRRAPHPIADARAGRADIGVVPVRAVRGLEPLLAPFLIDTFDLERKVLAGNVPAAMLARLAPLGVTGVGLLPGALERVLSTGRLMLRPSDFRGVAIGVRRSPLALATFRALGAAPAKLAPDPLRFSGFEQSLPEVVANHLAFGGVETTLPINVTLWPQMTSVVMNPQRYAALTSGQRHAVRDAAGAALTPAMSRLRRDEDEALHVVCRPPGHNPRVFILVVTPQSDRERLRRAVEPVYRRLERDPTAHTAVAAIEALRRQVAPAPAIVCHGDRPLRLHTAASPLDVRVMGDLTRTGQTTWEGAVTAPHLGPGRLVIKHRLLFRSFAVRRYVQFRARFARGQLHGCFDMTISPRPRGGFRWDGPGGLLDASPALRAYRGVSLRFSAVTKASDLRHARGGFVTGPPAGLVCLGV
jgi:TRAP-type transport system periplasmic protein